MDNITICKMQEVHVEDVYKISKDSFPMPWSKEELIKEVYRNKSCNLVALKDNKVIGFVQSWFFIDEADIINIAVNKKFRNNKIGHKLLIAVLENLKKSNIDTVFLEVRISNHQAEKLYKSVGFKVLYIRENYYMDGEDAYLMVLDIKNKNF
ncbi:MAG: ribosomal protein S18-alanine N-acetyltransferase [Clostridium sp.]|nr:ribosomal protein S18-alanine N-acetyltransferase [Clostridium sp.]